MTEVKRDVRIGDQAFAMDRVAEPSDTVELLTMTGGDLRWLFESGYAEGPFAISDRQRNEMRVVGEGCEIEMDNWGTEYLVWIPTRKGRDFALKTLRASGMYSGPGPEC